MRWFNEEDDKSIKCKVFHLKTNVKSPSTISISPRRPIGMGWIKFTSVIGRNKPALNLSGPPTA
jgi:hypothetical protein